MTCAKQVSVKNYCYVCDSQCMDFKRVCLSCGNNSLKKKGDIWVCNKCKTPNTETGKTCRVHDCELSSERQSLLVCPDCGTLFEGGNWVSEGYAFNSCPECSWRCCKACI